MMRTRRQSRATLRRAQVARQRLGEGMSYRELAREMGLSYAMVGYMATSPFYGADNLQPLLRTPDERQVQRALQTTRRYVAGESYREIAADEGLTTTAIWHRIHTSGASRVLWERGQLAWVSGRPRLPDPSLLTRMRQQLAMPTRWSKYAEAWSRYGFEVPAFDESAVAWSLWGALQHAADQVTPIDQPRDAELESRITETHDAMLAAVDGFQWCGLTADHECDIDCWAQQDDITHDDVLSMLSQAQELLS